MSTRVLTGRPRVGGPRRRPAPAPQATDAGSLTLEYAILVPVVLLMLFTCIQIALYSYARSVALTAAEEAANAQRAYGAPAGAGADKARSVIQAQGDVLRDWNVAVSPPGAEITVTVTGRSLSVLPGFNGYRVSQTASGPTEQFYR